MPRKTVAKTTSSITVNANPIKDITARPKRVRSRKTHAVAADPVSVDPDPVGPAIIAVPAPAASSDDLASVPQAHEQESSEAAEPSVVRKPPFSPAADGASKAPKPGTKQALVVDLLAREAGATVAEIQAVTGWLPHTTRAALTGLRKRGHVLAGSKGPDGERRYRILTPAPATCAFEDSSTNAGKVQ